MTVSELITELTRYDGSLRVLGGYESIMVDIHSVTEEILAKTGERVIVLDVDYMF